VPSMFCRGSVDCRRSRLGRRIDGFRRDSGPLPQEPEVGAVASVDSTEEGGLTLDQLLRRSHRELGPVELLLQGMKDIVVDRALTA
jgi:hypothetical protein